MSRFQNENTSHSCHLTDQEMVKNIPPEKLHVEQHHQPW